ncbi:MAG: glycosyltransferase family 2 protein, partial [Bryobacteraceae bacterium]
ALFRQVGGFNAAYGSAAGEDRDFCARWIARGWRLAEPPGIFVAHRHPQSLAGFLRKHFEYGRAALRHHSGAAGGSRAGLWFVLDLVRRSFREDSGARAVGLALLAVLSQAATFAGYLRERMSPRRA